MFTGIIRELGTVERVARSRGLVRLTIHAARLTPTVERLESVAVNGICMSVVEKRQGSLLFELIPETQRLTTLGTLRPGTRVNLEPSLSVTDRLSGHILFGHIDGVGTVVNRRQLAGELVLELRLASNLRKFLVPKGPVAVDGVSLTVGRINGATAFTIHLIPETLRQTTLGARAVGAKVNVEVDYFAKLVREILARRSILADSGNRRAVRAGT